MRVRVRVRVRLSAAVVRLHRGLVDAREERGRREGRKAGKREYFTLNERVGGAGEQVGESVTKNESRAAMVSVKESDGE